MQDISRVNFKSSIFGGAPHFRGNSCLNQQYFKLWELIKYIGTFSCFIILIPDTKFLFSLLLHLVLLCALLSCTLYFILSQKGIVICKLKGGIAQLYLVP